MLPGEGTRGLMRRLGAIYGITQNSAVQYDALSRILPQNGGICRAVLLSGDLGELTTLGG